MDKLFGTKVYDHNKQQVGVLIKTYKLGYVDVPELLGAKVLNPKGEIYSTKLDNLTPIYELSGKEAEILNIPTEFIS